jgi:hypothetical protein
MNGRLAYPTLMVFDLILAGTAVVGGVFVVPNMPMGWLAGTPLTSYLFPAMALTVIGLVGFIGAIELAFERVLGVFASLAAGLAMIGFQAVQFTVLTRGDWRHAFGINAATNALGPQPTIYSETVFITLGLGMAILALRVWCYPPSIGEPTGEPPIP